MTDPKDLLDNIQRQLMSDEARQAYHAKIKAESYMRWLAFYYLGRREHSQKELRDKLLAKACDADAIEALLLEFASEGYQSDERMTSAMIKEGIGKGYGHQRIWHDCKKRGLTTLKSARDIDAWIEQHADFFSDLLINDIEPSPNPAQTDLSPQVVFEADWLLQAVQARVKKYGNDRPIDQKEKARQLRFLQYRGFALDVCFQALQHDLSSLAERGE